MGSRIGICRVFDEVLETITIRVSVLTYLFTLKRSQARVLDEVGLRSFTVTDSVPLPRLRGIISWNTALPDCQLPDASVMERSAV